MSLPSKVSDSVVPEDTITRDGCQRCTGRRTATLIPGTQGAYSVGVDIDAVCFDAPDLESRYLHGQRDRRHALCQPRYPLNHFVAYHQTCLT
jgi:hypothetical protein